MPEKPSYEALEEKIIALEKTVEKQKRIRRTSRAAIRRHRRFLRFLPYPVAVRDINGLITYLNPAFTRTFGWSLKELRGKRGSVYVPVELRHELYDKLKALPPAKSILQYETQRLTKDGRLLDVIARVGIDMDKDNNPLEMIFVLKDITMEKRISRSQNIMNRISKALPQYPRLRQLLFYINNEIKELIGTESATTLLLTRDAKEIYFVSATHDDPDTRAQIEKARFPVDELIAGRVVKTGEPIMINDVDKDTALHQSRDSKIGYKVRNVLLVPLRVKERIIGTIAADNKKNGDFDETDMENLNTLASTVALSIENARVSNRLRMAYEELKSINKAKDKMISHLSHELKTPLAVLLTSIKILAKRLEALPDKSWEPTLERIKRNLERIVGIEDEVYDIVEKKDSSHHQLLNIILEQCQDELEALIEEQTGTTGVIRQVRRKIEEIFDPRDLEIGDIFLDQFVKDRLSHLEPEMAHRHIEFITELSPCPPVRMPKEPLKKTVDGLIRNAVENTPDNGIVELIVTKEDPNVKFMVRDHGIGLTREAQKRIFDGFFTTQETLKYSSKRPFDFNAGGKGADLLRMKIFSERYHFKISMDSRRCRKIPEDEDACPGTIEDCRKIPGPSCNGMTTVTCLFPFADAHPVPDNTL